MQTSRCQILSGNAGRVALRLRQVEPLAFHFAALPGTRVGEIGHSASFGNEGTIEIMILPHLVLLHGSNTKPDIEILERNLILLQKGHYFFYSLI